MGPDECDDGRVVPRTFYSWQAFDAVRSAEGDEEPESVVVLEQQRLRDGYGHGLRDRAREVVGVDAESVGAGLTLLLEVGEGSERGTIM